MQIKLLIEIENIKKIMHHPKIWKNISEDNCEVEPIIIPDVVDYWGIYDEDLMGFYRIDRISSCCKEFHTALTPEIWGKRSKMARDLMYEKIKIYYPFCRTLITKVPSYNRLALKYAKDGGMSEVGILKDSWNSSIFGLCDLIILSREVS